MRVHRYIGMNAVWKDSTGLDDLDRKKLVG